MEENTEINLLVGDQSTFKHLLLDFYKKNPTIEILHEHFSTSVVLMDNPDKSKVSGIIQQNLPDKVPVIFCTAMIFFKMQPKEQAS